MEAGRPTLIACGNTLGWGPRLYRREEAQGLDSYLFASWMQMPRGQFIHTPDAKPSLPQWVVLSGTVSGSKLLHPEAAFCRALCHSSSGGDASLAESAVLFFRQQLPRLLPVELKLHESITCSQAGDAPHPLPPKAGPKPGFLSALSTLVHSFLATENRPGCCVAFLLVSASQET